MKVLICLLVAVAGVQSVQHLGLCQDHFPKPGCTLTTSAICTESCGWGESIETYMCAGNAESSCARACINRSCPSDPAVLPCSTEQHDPDCVRVWGGKCGKDCGIGFQHELYLCGGGMITCKRQCCCQPCNFNRGGPAPPILCRDLPGSPQMCPHMP